MTRNKRRDKFDAVFDVLEGLKKSLEIREAETAALCEMEKLNLPQGQMQEGFGGCAPEGGPSSSSMGQDGLGGDWPHGVYGSDLQQQMGFQDRYFCIRPGTSHALDLASGCEIGADGQYEI